VKYSVKDVCDVNNLNYVDVLFSIGAQLYIQYIDAGKKLEPELIKELEGWRKNIEQLREQAISAEASVEGGIRAFFLSMLAKIKAEDTTRKIIRETIEPRLSELIDKINLITTRTKGKKESACFNRRS
jgi:hypothetical protein